MLPISQADTGLQTGSHGCRTQNHVTNNSSTATYWPVLSVPSSPALSPHWQDWGGHQLGLHDLDGCIQSSVVTFDIAQVSPGSVIGTNIYYNIASGVFPCICPEICVVLLLALPEPQRQLSDLLTYVLVLQVSLALLVIVLFMYKDFLPHYYSCRSSDCHSNFHFVCPVILLLFCFHSSSIFKASHCFYWQSGVSLPAF